MEPFIPRTRKEKSQISIRLNNNIIKILNEKADKLGISRNELICQCIITALDNLQNDK